MTELTSAQLDSDPQVSWTLMELKNTLILRSLVGIFWTVEHFKR